MDSAELEKKITVYAGAFLGGYKQVINKHFKSVHQQTQQLGLDNKLFPLFDKEIGQTTSLAVFYTEFDFFLFFLNETNQALHSIQLPKTPEFNQDWAFDTPHEIKQTRVKEYLGITAKDILCEVSIPGATNFLSHSIESLEEEGRSHGIGRGNAHGGVAAGRLPSLMADKERAEQLKNFSDSYGLLAKLSNEQERGRKFEKLWQDVLEFHGWKPKKFRISGEENDFTAIYEGNHILGEVRWYKSPMNGGKMREFLGKLDPRPQTIGLFISYSGFDDGAISVARRAVNSKTVVLFSKKEIDAVLIDRTPISDIFNDSLREVFDRVLEQT